ncbi:MAG: PEP-CTERM sorting domain-containing protein [Gammaproteobacteria bacterium]
MTPLKHLRACALALLLAAPLGASAAAITGNTTSVELTAADALASLGVAVQPVGTASLEAVGPTALFPITGGSVDDGSGALLVEHEGSGLSLGVGTDNILLLNFLIDSAAATIFGDVVVVDDVAGSLTASALNDVDLFSLDSSLNVFLTATAAGALNGLFGTALPAGLKIGEASLDVAVVPLPPAVLLLGSAVAGMAALRRAA